MYLVLFGVLVDIIDTLSMLLTCMCSLCIDLSFNCFFLSRPRWVVPVLPKGELEVLLEAAIDLSKKGKKNTV